MRSVLTWTTQDTTKYGQWRCCLAEAPRRGLANSSLTVLHCGDMKMGKFRDPREKTLTGRFTEAYFHMVKEAQYRAYPIYEKPLASMAELQDEAAAYSEKFLAEDTRCIFHIGCSDFDTNRALVYTIEAARALCGATPNLARRLLQLAQDEIRRERPE